MPTVKARKKEAFAVYTAVCKFRGFLASSCMRSSKMELEDNKCLIL